jgi:hypothetical protein
MSIRTAQRAMQAAEMVERNDKLSYLPADGLLALSSRAAKPRVEKIIRRIDAGDKPSAAEIKEEIEDARWVVKREPHKTKPLPAERGQREQEKTVNERPGEVRRLTPTSCGKHGGQSGEASPKVF